MKNVKGRLENVQQVRIFKSGVIAIVNQYFTDMKKVESERQKAMAKQRKRSGYRR